MGTKYRNGTSYHGAFPAQVIQELVQDLCDMVYPVGCYFETTDTDFDPNDVFVGTWVLETEGLVHISSGENYEISTDAQDGGNKNITYTPVGTVDYHTLTAAESGLPAHGHSMYSRNGAGTGSYYAAPPTSANAGTSKTYSDIIIQSTAKNATSGHNHGFTGTQTTLDNMQPYKIVNRWYRTE